MTIDILSSAGPYLVKEKRRRPRWRVISFHDWVTNEVQRKHRLAWGSSRTLVDLAIGGLR
jgi:hypothetical protein